MTSPPWIVFRPIQTTGLMRVLDEAHGAVAEAGVDAAGVPAARAGVEVDGRETAPSRRAASARDR